MRIERLHNDKHKFVAIFKDGKRTKFGASGYSDYTMHHDKTRRDRYRQRHKKDLETSDPQKAGFLSYYILWGDHTSIGQNLMDFRRKFGL